MKNLFVSILLLSFLAPMSAFAANACIDNSAGATPVDPLPSGECPPGSVPTSNGVQTSYMGNGNIKYVPLEPIPGFDGSGELNFGELLSAIFKVLIIIGGFIAIGAFVYAGIQYMMSEVVGTKSDAKKRLKASLMGLFLLIASWLILYTINPQLVTFGGALNPVAPNFTFVPVAAPNTPSCNNGVGIGCINQSQQNDISNVQNNRAAAGDQALQSALQTEQAQQAACVSGGGSILAPGALSVSPCRNRGFTSCDIVAGPTGYRCGK